MIEPLNTHFSFTSPASIHDEEALTALELAGRQGAKINEIVKDQNNLRTETENHMTEQDNTIDKRMDTQDKNIQNIRDVTVPADVKAECNRLIVSGEFDKAIELYLDNLNDRVNNLLGTVTEGTTTMDAEIIDGRVDMNGKPYSNIGLHIRKGAEQTDNTFDFFINAAQVSNYENINILMNAGNFLDNQGKYTSVSSTSYYASNAYPVTPGEILYIESSAILTNSHYAFYDSDDNVILNKSTETGATETFKGLVRVPANSDHVRISGVNNNNLGKLYRITEITLVGSSLHDYTMNTGEYLCGLLSSNTKEKIEVEIVANYILNQADGMPLATSNTDNRFMITKPIPVVAGECYHIKGSCALESWEYCFYDKTGSKVAGVQGDSAYHNFEHVVVVPLNCVELRVSELNDDDRSHAEIYKMKPTKNTDHLKQWGHLKWGCMGDSVTERNSRSSKFYHDYINEKTGIQIVNMGSSGTGYKRSEEEGKAFYQRILTIPSDCDVVTIFGSGNDLKHYDVLGEITDTGTDTICGCVNKTIDELYNIIPTVQLGIVSPTPWVGNTPSDNGKMEKYSEKLKELCEHRSIPFLDLFHCSGLRPNDESYRNLVYSKDDGNGVHPNEIGHKILSSHFYNFLNSLIGTY